MCLKKPNLHHSVKSVTTPQHYHMLVYDYRYNLQWGNYEIVTDLWRNRQRLTILTNVQHRAEIVGQYHTLYVTVARNGTRINIAVLS